MIDASILWANAPRLLLAVGLVAGSAAAGAAAAQTPVGICFGITASQARAQGANVIDRTSAGSQGMSIVGTDDVSRLDFIIGSPGPDTIDALAGDDIACGGGGDDLLLGGPGSDRFAGGFGSGDDDVPEVGIGHDTLDGETLTDIGNDTLDGGAGNDACDGGRGVDIAVACERLTNTP